MKQKIMLLCMVLTLGATNQAVAGIVFEDNFNGNLDQWIGGLGGDHHGEIVTAPAGNADTALTFYETNTNGDIFTIDTFAAGAYTLVFDYFGDTTLYNPPNDNTGGYLGISNGLPFTHTWLFGTSEEGSSSSLIELVDDNTWHTYETTFTSADAFHLMLEDYTNSGGGPGDAFFDNIVLTQHADPVPEPATMLLFGIGLTGLAGVTRIRKEKQ